VIPAVLAITVEVAGGRSSAIAHEESQNAPPIALEKERDSGKRGRRLGIVQQQSRQMKFSIQPTRKSGVGKALQGHQVSSY
jgi:hypothetical protein